MFVNIVYSTDFYFIYIKQFTALLWLTYSIHADLHSAAFALY